MGSMHLDAKRVENAEGVGGQHNGAPDVERRRAGLVDGAREGLMVEGEGEAQAREAGTDDSGCGGLGGGHRWRGLKCWDL